MLNSQDIDQQHVKKTLQYLCKAKVTYISFFFMTLGKMRYTNPHGPDPCPTQLDPIQLGGHARVCARSFGPVG